MKAPGIVLQAAQAWGRPARWTFVASLTHWLLWAIVSTSDITNTLKSGGTRMVREK